MSKGFKGAMLQIVRLYLHSLSPLSPPKFHLPVLLRAPVTQGQEPMKLAGEEKGRRKKGRERLL